MKRTGAQAVAIRQAYRYREVTLAQLARRFEMPIATVYWLLHGRSYSSYQRLRHEDMQTPEERNWAARKAAHAPIWEKTMTPEERTEAARNAARARWEKVTPEERRAHARKAACEFWEKVAPEERSAAARKLAHARWDRREI
jgi:hypothetical protein